jgi:NADH:ubiquinone reductase (H+-translocating)
MNRFLRRAILGALASSIAGLALVLLHTMSFPEFAVAVIAGTTYASCFPPAGLYADNIMAAASLGIPLWGVTNVIFIPLVFTNRMAWDAAGMKNNFAPLLDWILFGAGLGALLQLMSRIAETQFGPEVLPTASAPASIRRIVILGGGFAGMKTAESIEEQFVGDASVSVLLISESNALLFTPMLAEVAGGSLEPSEISVPLRSSLRRTRFVRARVSGLDPERRTVRLDGLDCEGANPHREVEYDYLVIALGAVSNYLGLANVERFAFDFKTLFDAIRIRNHVIEMFERADRETDPDTRKRLLTFVIAGGGFAGVELAGALNDFSHGILADYRNLTTEDLCIALVHSRDRILPELSETLASYALEKMTQRGVVFRLGVRLLDAQPGLVILSDGQIATDTLVWTAGTAPSPLIKELGLPVNTRGALLVDSTLQVENHPEIWALGDCAAVMNSETGKPYPPTAQFALREAVTISKNIAASLRGAAAESFRFTSLGALCVIGHQTACAELTIPFAPKRSLRFSGLLAWLMWRAIYLSKLSGLERKIRVLTAWVLELFFPKDIIQTVELEGKAIHGSNQSSNHGA